MYRRRCATLTPHFCHSDTHRLRPCPTSVARPVANVVAPKAVHLRGFAEPIDVDLEICDFDFTLVGNRFIPRPSLFLVTHSRNPPKSGPLPELKMDTTLIVVNWYSPRIFLGQIVGHSLPLASRSQNPTIYQNECLQQFVQKVGLARQIDISFPPWGLQHWSATQ